MLRAFQWDLARQVERLDWLIGQLPRYAEWGYNELYLHLEDAVEYPSLPGVARSDAYTYRQMQQLVEAAGRAGIKVVPIVNLLGHTQYLIKVPELRELNERRDQDGAPLAQGQICPVHPRTLEVARRLLADVAPFCTAGRVHFGLDESFQLGAHPRSRQEIARIGLAGHFGRYVRRLRDLAHSRGLQMGMWADMLYFLPGAVPLLPPNIALYEWYYYPFRRRPRVELFNFAESDLGERLRRRGLEYWGCPMNGAFRFEPLPHFTDRLENIVSWWRRCRRLDAAGMLVTSWEPNRLAMELTTVVDAAAASLWLDDIEEPRAMLERGFARVFGRKQRFPRAPAGRSRSQAAAAAGLPMGGAAKTGTAAARLDGAGSEYPQAFSMAERRRARVAARLALACDRHPFGGYPRWEINGRWDVVSRRESLAPYRDEERWFRKLRAAAPKAGAPAPLRASLDLRWCLAERDVLVREAARGADVSPSRLRSCLTAGLRAARTMWAGTRTRQVRGPNEQILRSDLARLEAWAHGDAVFGAPWQLCYRVRNFAPAVQLVAVEQQRDDGRWEMRQACHTIEFQGVAAQPRAGMVREHAAPIAWDGNAARLPRVRFVVRGVGQVAIEDVTLTDGRAKWRVRPAATKLGHPAPRRGWPALTHSTAGAVLTFSIRR